MTQQNRFRFGHMEKWPHADAVPFLDQIKIRIVPSALKGTFDLTSERLGIFDKVPYRQPKGEVTQTDTFVFDFGKLDAAELPNSSNSSLRQAAHNKWTAKLQLTWACEYDLAAGSCKFMVTEFNPETVKVFTAKGKETTSQAGNALASLLRSLAPIEAFAVTSASNVVKNTTPPPVAVEDADSVQGVSAPIPTPLEQRVAQLEKEVRELRVDQSQYGQLLANMPKTIMDMLAGVFNRTTQQMEGSSVSSSTTQYNFVPVSETEPENEDTHTIIRNADKLMVIHQNKVLQEEDLNQHPGLYPTLQEYLENQGDGDLYLKVNIYAS